MSPIATTSDAAPSATPKRARSETVFGRPRRLPRRKRFARKAGTFIGALVCRLGRRMVLRASAVHRLSCSLVSLPQPGACYPAFRHLTGWVFRPLETYIPPQRDSPFHLALASRLQDAPLPDLTARLRVAAPPFATLRGRAGASRPAYLHERRSAGSGPSPAVTVDRESSLGPGVPLAIGRPR